MRTPIATPRLMAGRHSADRRHYDSTRTPASWTPRAARHRSSGVGRRAETRPTNPLNASRKRRQKGDGGTFGPAFSPIIDAPQAPDITAAKPSRRFRLIPRTSRQPRVVQEVRVGVAPLTRNPAAMRDFGPRNGETRTRTGDTTIFSRAVGDGRTHAIPGNHAILRWPEPQIEVRYLRAFARSSGDGGDSSPLFADALSGVAAPDLTRTTSA
jgi:hypothetical protein